MFNQITGISVKNEHDDPEINAMALKMKENYQKNATAAAKQQAASPANVYINRAGRAVTLVNTLNSTNNTPKNDQEKLPKDSEDVESVKGKLSGISLCSEISFENTILCFLMYYRYI